MKKQDIQKAVSLFKEWDNNGKWDKPNILFINHTLKKAEDSLNTAKALLNIITNKELREKSLPNTEYSPHLWIINSAYYSMFFLAQVLLGKDGRKMPEGTRDTHRTVLFAILYYFLIKGSDLEGKKKIEWNDIKSSRMSNALIILQKAQEETEKLLQIERAKEAVSSLQLELHKRAELTYRTTKSAELSFAKTSIERADRFWEIINEYMQAREN